MTMRSNFTVFLFYFVEPLYYVKGAPFFLLCYEFSSKNEYWILSNTCSADIENIISFFMII